ncbi:MAG: amidohydrolase family protein [Candidatus Hydrogenedentes bacterium]|nr:amidohydrolase family protein [Candidatus Hydrogenedentota bacterium]
MTQELIDTNVYIGPWPTRRVPGDDSAALTEMLRGHGVTQAWAGSFDSLLHKDIAGVNARLAQACAASGGLLVPFGAINPALPQWEDDVRRCAEEHRMPGIRLHPNYHGYALDDPRFTALLQAAADRKLLVQIAITMEDERMMHPLMQVPHVDVLPLPDLLAVHPGLRVVLLNAFRGVPMPLVQRLAETKQVCFDLAWLEGAAGLEVLKKQIPLERVLFGSYAPLFYFASSWLKLAESPLSETERAALMCNNAAGLLAAP